MTAQDVISKVKKGDIVLVEAEWIHDREFSTAPLVKMLGEVVELNTKRLRLIAESRFDVVEKVPMSESGGSIEFEFWDVKCISIYSVAKQFKD